MKSKLKKLFLIGFALSVLISCSVVDLEEHEHGIEASIKSRKISFNEFKSNTKAFNVINDVNKKNVVASTALNRIIRDTIRNFSIDTQEGLYITYANLHSFTFPVYRDVDNGKLENLVLSYQSDGSYKVKLLIYNLTPQEKIDLALNRLKSILNPVITIPIQNFDTNFIEAGSCEEITETIYIACSSGNHSFGSGTGMECSYWNLSGGTPPQVVTRTRIKCVYSDSSPGGGSGAGSEAGGPGGGGGDGNEYPPNYPSNDTPPEDYNLGISIPVKPKPIKTPCNQIKTITNNTANLKANINSLNTNATLNLNYEKGFEYKDDANGNSQPTVNNGIPGDTGITIKIPTNGTMNFVLHSHYTAPGMMPCFTFEDLLVFSKIHKYKKNNSKPLDKLTYMVVTQAGVFAIVLEDETALENLLLSLQTNTVKKVKDDFYKNFPDNEDSDNEYIKALIKSLSAFGTGLYQANADLSNWSRLTVNENNNIIPNPCN